MRKVLIFILIFIILSLPLFNIAIGVVQTEPLTYHPLISDFPEVTTPKDGAGDFASYVNTIIRVIIGLTGVLAVLMIVLGGIQYVSTDSWNDKDSGKKRIQAAVGGLLLALSSYLILNTIDPSLTELNFAKDLKPIGDINNTGGGIGVGGEVGPSYDENESISLDPTGQTGKLNNSLPAGNTSIDTCEGLSSYRSSGNYSASDKGGTSGAVVGEIAWLMQAVPQKWPGLRVSSSYRSLEWNLESAYGVKDAQKRSLIIAELAQTDESYSSRLAIARKYGLKQAALTSRHVLGKAVDFNGPGLSNGQVDQLVAWARNNKCLKITEVLWQVAGHYDHVHLGI